MIKKAKRRKSKWPQYSEEKILSMLHEYDSQKDLTVVDFCKFHKIHKSTFYNWRNLYTKRSIIADKPKGFLTVEVTKECYPSISSTSTLFAEVNGIRLYHFVPADYLKALLS